MPEWLAALTRTWRAVVPITALLVWIGFALLPAVHPAFQFPVQVAVAVLAGVSAELIAAGPSAAARRLPLDGSYWVVPSGVVLAAGGWLVGIARSWWLPFLPAAAVTLTILVQSVEVNGPPTVRGVAHALTIVVGFGLALTAYGFAEVADPGRRLISIAVVTAALTLVVLRQPGRSMRSIAMFAMLATLIVTELSVVLFNTTLPAGLYSGLLLLALYAASATCYALLDQAVPRAYFEIGLVSLGSLAVSALVLHRGG